MVIVLFVIFAIILIAINTAVLAGALLITGEEEITKDSLIKCLAVTTLAFVIGLVPFIGWISGIVWLVALMVVFEKDLFPEAVLIAVACWVINLVVGFGLGMIAVAMGGS